MTDDLTRMFISSFILFRLPMFPLQTPPFQYYHQLCYLNQCRLPLQEICHLLAKTFFSLARTVLPCHTAQAFCAVLNLFCSKSTFFRSLYKIIWCYKLLFGSFFHLKLDIMLSFRIILLFQTDTEKQMTGEFLWKKKQRTFQKNYFLTDLV